MHIYQYLIQSIRMITNKDSCIIMDNQLILIILVCVVFAIYVWLKEFLIKKAEKRLAKRLGIDESWRNNR
jgi:ABC-type Mn2+/Zn2+ transport system permease subunit